MRYSPFSRWASRIVFGLFFGLVLISAHYCYAGKVASYSANQVFLDAEGTVQRTAKLYVTPEKFRMEGFPMGPHKNLVVILRRDLKIHWTLNTEKKTYFERPLDEKEMQGAMQGTFKRSNEEDLGSEKVSGYKCRKKRVTITTNFMGMERKSKSTYWTSKKFDMPLRTQSEDGTVTELRNIKKGKQPKSLFELSKGYKKVAGMLELLGPPSEEKTQGTVPKTKEETKGFQIPDEVRKKLPKGFKLPFGK